MIVDSKKEYIARQLKRTFNKKYENYCITRIWHKLDRLDVQIITQQMFRRDSKHIALADLYFPQFNLIIEVDENQHLDSKKEDQKRTEEIQKEVIKRKIAHLEEVVSGDLEVKRIAVDDSKTLEDINTQIENIVKDIQERIEKLGESFKSWTNEKKKPQEYINGGNIKVDDNAYFRTILEVSSLFRKDYKGMQRCIFNVGNYDNTKVWCPKLRITDDDYKGNRFDNRFSEDGEYIYESSIKRPVHFMKEALESNEVRYVFPQYRNELGEFTYKFVGVYKIDKDETLRLKKRAWKKISDTIDLTVF